MLMLHIVLSISVAYEAIYIALLSQVLCMLIDSVRVFRYETVISALFSEVALASLCSLFLR